MIEKHFFCNNFVLVVDFHTRDKICLCLIENLKVLNMFNKSKEAN